MSLRTLSIRGVRNLNDNEINLSQGVNVFFGDNGAGKTSVLESVHLLAMNRSFQQSRTRTAVSLNADLAILSAELCDGDQLLVKRSSDGKSSVALNGKAVTSVSSLVTKLPTQLIHSGSFKLLEGSPSDRRKYLDWGVFHTSSDFMAVWQHFQKCLKNRNSLLRSGKIDRSQMAVWEQGFIESAVKIDQMRQRYLAEFSPVFKQILQQLVELDDVDISYYRGWDKTKDFSAVLEAQRHRDLKLGYSQSGPQRADLKVKVSNLNAVDVLSRGQQKLVVCALKIAQSRLLQSKVTQPSIFLVDDLPSELDERHIHKLCLLLEEIGCQVFMTAIEPDTFKNIWLKPDQIDMFHVEHGSVTRVTNLGESNV
ncbi:DNA replication/repair protein RecF [Reinekea thalattae]|uniref:DNA replication and repair protein RecF n=1 Tax=Reinekea thalattae TaxID=2593301 RepID=A0A5C8ZCU2_9GAMM|nr:DNA replication/repair protein RecF [Reinekea thalattae]TXR54726.1 DNA replication/repair protein RecF [Reinekea thalattae]